MSYFTISEVTSVLQNEKAAFVEPLQIDDNTQDKNKYTISQKQGPIFIPSRRGNKILLFNGYTYNQGHLNCPRYYCTKKYKSCKAKVRLDKNDSVIVEVLETHNHEPPVLEMSEIGKYIPIVN
ncbi:uncharacterized protein [Choristoneura fumiferana]|uniref:uncharacterized protein n=1 Tax=Choristoneura fumiferana TaxID=7141 RepID=UPI003D15A038